MQKNKLSFLIVLNYFLATTESNSFSPFYNGNDPYESLQDADALLIATEWSLFRTPDFERMKKMMKSNVIFDGRNLYDLQKMSEIGFYYNSIGREVVSPQVPAFS